jgi:CheY-like chemotaxis protein
MTRILLVEDEPDTRHLTRLMLERMGYEVMEAEDGEEALEILDRDRPDLVLLDIMLPGIDGWEVCRKIKTRDALREIPVVVFTVRASLDSVNRSRECGAEAHVNKPFERDELLGTLERVLAGSRPLHPHP